ncbi:transportin-3 isoform X2, partial [Paramuricea clavata]
NLKNSLLNHITQLHNSTQAILNQLCMAVADFVVQMPQWSNPVKDLVEKFSKTIQMIPALLEILLYLTEEIFCCLGGWLLLGAYPPDEVMKSRLFPVLFETLVNDKASQNLKEAATDVLCYAIFSVGDLEPQCQMAAALSFEVLKLVPMYEQAKSNSDHDSQVHQPGSTPTSFGDFPTTHTRTFFGSSPGSSSALVPKVSTFPGREISQKECVKDYWNSQVSQPGRSGGLPTTHTRTLFGGRPGSSSALVPSNSVNSPNEEMAKKIKELERQLEDLNKSKLEGE